MHWQAGASKVCGVGVQKPRSAGVCWPAAQPLRGPCEGYSKRPSLGGGVAGTKVLGVWVLHTAEAGGRRPKGEGARLALSWGWLPGARRAAAVLLPLVRAKLGLLVLGCRHLWAQAFALLYLDES